MVPYSAFMTLKERAGPQRNHPLQPVQFSRYSGASGQGLSPPPMPSQAIREVAAKTLPEGTTSLSKAFPTTNRSGATKSLYVFLIVLAFVYLVLAAQYESFIIPLAVVFSLPVGVFGSFLLLKLMGLENNIYAQIGLIMLVGLLGKNAVLIVEFAVQKRQQGATILERSH